MMAQITSGWRAIFSVPAVYRLAQWGIGSPRVRQALVSEYLEPHPDDAVLDIGCGTGDMTPYLEACSYVGFDMSEAYIEAARDRYPDAGEFRVGTVGTGRRPGESFDAAFAKGVLHHLDDDESVALFQEAHDALTPGGRLVTIDPCYADGQSKVASMIISRDRGQNVRSPADYVALAGRVFDDVEVDVRHDLLRVPYSHAVVTCRRSG